MSPRSYAKRRCFCSLERVGIARVFTQGHSPFVAKGKMRRDVTIFICEGGRGEWCGGANNVCGGVEVSARVAEVPAKGLRVGAGGGLATY